MSLRVIIADDHPLLVEGLSKVLQEIGGVELLPSVMDGRSLLSQLRRHGADIVLLDLNMPKMDGIDSLKIIRKEFPACNIVVFTSYDQPKLAAEIKSLGASGFLPKSSASATIKEAIVRVANGGTWFPGGTALTPVAELKYIDNFEKKFQLTPREVEIIRMIATGLSTKAISEQLFLSEFTVNTHRRNIGRKLDIFTPVALVNFAREHGIVP